MVCAYAFAEIDSPEAAEARLICGSDDQIAVWLNGEKVHDFGGSRGFDADTGRSAAPSQGGMNRLFVKIGNISGTWEFAARIPGFGRQHFTPRKGSRRRTRSSAPLRWQRSRTARGCTPGTPRHGEAAFSRSRPGRSAASAPLPRRQRQRRTSRAGPQRDCRELQAARSHHRASWSRARRSRSGSSSSSSRPRAATLSPARSGRRRTTTLTILGADAQPHVVKRPRSRRALPCPLPSCRRV